MLCPLPMKITCISTVRLIVLFLLFSCDALCPGRWIAGRFSPYCGQHQVQDPASANASHQLETAVAGRSLPSNSNAPLRRPPIPLMALRLPAPHHFFRCSSLKTGNIETMPPSPYQASRHSHDHSTPEDQPFAIPQPSPRPVQDSEITLSRLLSTGNFLTSLRSLIIEAMKWTTTETPISMMARSGSEFASLPLSIRTAIITADLVIRADLDAAEARRQQEIQ